MNIYIFYILLYDIVEYEQDNSEILTSRTDTCYLEGKTVQCTKVFFFPTNACHKELIAKKILKNSISTIRNNFPNSFPHVCKHAASLRSLRWGNLSRPPLPASTHSIAHTHTHTDWCRSAASRRCSAAYCSSDSALLSKQPRRREDYVSPQAKRFLWHDLVTSWCFIESGRSLV